MAAAIVGIVTAATAACNGSALTPTASSSPWSAVVAKTTPLVPVEIQMVGYRYVPSEITVRAGKVVFYLVNPASESYAHNMVITDPAGAELARSPSVRPDTTVIFTVSNLPPGAYEFGSTLEGIGYSADGPQASHGMVGRLFSIPDYKANSSTSRGASQPAGSIHVLMAQGRFDPSTIHAKTGSVVFYLVSPATEGLSHNMVITDAEGRVMAASSSVDPGRSAVFIVLYLPPGTYGFLSTLGGPDDPTQLYQADAGMMGTLTVTS